MTQRATALCIQGIPPTLWSFPITDQTQTVGRSHFATIRIGDRSVSRDHARVQMNGSSVRIRDSYSRNGTWLSNQRVMEVDLQPGDEIGIGSHFRLILVGQGDTDRVHSRPDACAEMIREHVSENGPGNPSREHISSMYSLAIGLRECHDAMQVLVATHDWVADWLKAELSMVISTESQKATLTDSIAGRDTVASEYEPAIVERCRSAEAPILIRNVARHDARRGKTLRRNLIAFPLDVENRCHVIYGELKPSTDCGEIHQQLDFAFRAATLRNLELRDAFIELTDTFDPQRSSPAHLVCRLTPTQRQILKIIEDVGQRMTTSQIMNSLETANGAASHGSTKQMLAEMVRHGFLNNRQDKRPCGYGFPTWS